MNPFFERDLRLSRRQFFAAGAQGIGVAALSTLLAKDGFAGFLQTPQQGLHHPAKAKRVIVLWQGGAPSQVDLFDYKPGLEKRRLEELPKSLLEGKRLSTMTSEQGKYPVLPAIKPFRQYGESVLDAHVSPPVLDAGPISGAVLTSLKFISHTGIYFLTR